MKHIYQISICFFIFVKISIAQDGWFWQYPKPQGNTLHDIFIFDQNTAIAVGDLGTVIKTTDGGNNWDVQHHIEGISSNITGCHFINEQTGWAVGCNTLIKTTDSGQTWSILYSDAPYILNCVYFFNPDTGFVFGNDGFISKTIDGGKNWTSQVIGHYLHYFNAACFSSADTGWVVGYGFYGNTIFKTTDGGMNWIQQNIEPVVYNLQDIHFIDNNTGFIVGHMGTFLKTTDGGKNWEYQNLWEKYQQDKYQYFYSVYFTDSENGWIVGGDYEGFILKTTDGGQNWIEEEYEIYGHLYKIRFSDRYNGWIMGQFGMIYKTSDGGNNWAPQRDENYWFSSIFFIDENTGWAVGDKGIILHTEDGGTNWFKQNQHDSLIFSSIFAINSQYAFAVGATTDGIYAKNAAILRTIDGGINWEMQTIDSLIWLYDVCFNNSTTGWISGNGTLLKTDDKGITWHEVTLDSAPPGGKIQFINENIGWIGGTLKTINGGENWFPQIIPVTSINSFYFVNSKIGWAVASSNGSNNILKTTDGGENWTPYSITPPGYNFSVQFVNETTGWISGYSNLTRNSIIIKTTDGGISWHDQQSPATNLSYIYMINETTGWAAGNGILKTTNGGGVVSVKDEKKLKSNLPEHIELFQNYPNPFNPSTTIHFKIFKPGYVLLKIYDILGREVETLVNDKREVGEYKIIWHVKGLPSGLYLCRLQAKDFIETKKLILLQ